MDPNMRVMHSSSLLHNTALHIPHLPLATPSAMVKQRELLELSKTSWRKVRIHSLGLLAYRTVNCTIT